MKRYQESDMVRLYAFQKVLCNYASSVSYGGWEDLGEERVLVSAENTDKGKKKTMGPNTFQDFPKTIILQKATPW